MTRERIIRMVAGSMVMLSVGLSVVVSPWWLALAVFVGLNLFQSSLSGWCLLEDILERGFHIPSKADKVRAEIQVRSGRP